MNKTIPISTHIINLAKRTDRKAHALAQFAERTEFKVRIVKAVEHQNGAYGLWQTIVKIVKQAMENEDEYVLICEDDHQFTQHYEKHQFLRQVDEAKNLEADILLGGVSWFEDGLEVAQNLFWINRFNGTQFVVVFRQFFDKLLNHDFKAGETADKIMYELSETKFVMYPFISIQKEFGYSDATEYNNREGYVNQIFETSSTIFSHMVKAQRFYQKH